MEKDIRIVFMGTPEFASNVLKGLVENNYNIVGAVSQPDKEGGRKRILTPSPVKEMALSHGLKVLTPYKIRKEYAEGLKEDGIDFYKIQKYLATELKVKLYENIAEGVLLKFYKSTTRMPRLITTYTENDGSKHSEAGTLLRG